MFIQYYVTIPGDHSDLQKFTKKFIARRRLEYLFAKSQLLDRTNDWLRLISSIDRYETKFQRDKIVDPFHTAFVIDCLAKAAKQAKTIDSLQVMRTILDNVYKTNPRLFRHKDVQLALTWFYKCVWDIDERRLDKFWKKTDEELEAWATMIMIFLTLRNFTTEHVVLYKQLLKLFKYREYVKEVCVSEQFIQIVLKDVKSENIELRDLAIQILGEILLNKAAAEAYIERNIPFNLWKFVGEPDKSLHAAIQSALLNACLHKWEKPEADKFNQYVKETNNLCTKFKK